MLCTLNAVGVGEAGSTCVSVLSHSVVSHSLWPHGPQPMGFARREYCSRLPFPTPGVLPDSQIKSVVTNGKHFRTHFTLKKKKILWKSVRVEKRVRKSIARVSGLNPNSIAWYMCDVGQVCTWPLCTSVLSLMKVVIL